MRLPLLLCLIAQPLHAWEFTPDPICTIWHTTETAEMRVTYDPREATPYTISVTLETGAWPETSPYAIVFNGLRSFTIATDRHRLSADGRAVIASDTGFGNVLNGLEFSLFATAVLGARTVEMPLTGAAEAVARFRDCTRPGLS